MAAAIRQIGTVVRWPFASQLASPLWLALRVYLGSVWLQFGPAKIRGGWLSGNPMQDLLAAIAAGQTPTPVPAYRYVAQLLVGLDLDGVLSVGIPLLEVALAAAFFAGVLLVPAAIGACLLNANLILSGIASWSYDGRIIGLQLLLLLAWRVAGELGLGESLSRLLRSYGALLRRRPA